MCLGLASFCIFRLHRTHSISGLILPVEFCVHSAGLSLCLLVMTVNSGKMAVSIEMPFAMMGQVGSKNHVLDLVPDSLIERGKFWGK